MEVKNYKSFSIQPLTDKAGEVFKRGIERMPCPYWVSAGTALGLYRDKDFIKGDTDLDIECLGYDGIDDDILEALDFTLIRTVDHEGKIMQMAFLEDDTIFDIYFYYEEDGVYRNHNEQGIMDFPKHYFDNLEMIQTKYGELPFPSPIEDYLKYRYGDWQTPSNKKGLYGQDF